MRFLRDTSLSATVQRLLAESAAGWTDKELRILLQVPVQPCLLAAVRPQRARRRQLGGVYVYLACEGPQAERQWQARQARVAASAAHLEPPAIITVLLALLRHPGFQPAQLARHLQGHSPPIPRQQVQAVWERFDLAEVVKKGGPTPC